MNETIYKQGLVDMYHSNGLINSQWADNVDGSCLQECYSLNLLILVFDYGTVDRSNSGTMFRCIDTFDSSMSDEVMYCTLYDTEATHQATHAWLCPVNVNHWLYPQPLSIWPNLYSVTLHSHMSICESHCTTPIHTLCLCFGVYLCLLVYNYMFTHTCCYVCTNHSVGGNTKQCTGNVCTVKTYCYI